MTRCPRCHARLLRNYDELLCLSCGVVREEPVRRPWDLVDSTRGGEVDSPKWTLEELALWGRWARGEPVPEPLRHYTCNVCGRRYDKERSMYSHRERQHKDARQMALGVTG